MTFDITEYCYLKDEILLKSDILNASDLKYFIHEYDAYINSRRRCSLINTFADLISVLEKRGCISSQSIDLLQPIINRIGDRKLLALASKITSAVSPNVASSTPNSYGCQGPPVSSKTDNGNKVKIPYAVIELISEEIGIKWRELGRNLGLKESHLNQIEARFPNDLKGRAYECLIKFQDDKQDITILIEALKKVRRNDIRQDVEKLLLRQ